MLNVHFILNDDDAKIVLKAKGKQTWREFILTLVKGDDENERI